MKMLVATAMLASSAAMAAPPVINRAAIARPQDGAAIPATTKASVDNKGAAYDAVPKSCMSPCLTPISQT